jgi:hypothetical protein
MLSKPSSQELVSITKVSLRDLPNSEVVDPLPGLQFCSKPTRCLPSSRPGLGRPVRIPKLRNNSWVRAPPCQRTLALSFDATLELLQAIFEYALLRKQRGCKPGGDFFVECPQLIRGHRFKDIPVHDRPQSGFDVAPMWVENMSRIRPIQRSFKYLFQAEKFQIVDLF